MNSETIFLLGMMYFMLYASIFWLLVYFERRKEVKTDPNASELPAVSIIVPAYNEEATIAKVVDSALALDYPEKEIIVVNDGSTDRTREICEKYAKKGLIKLVNKMNSGKASALNVGISKSRNDFVCCIDADSFFEPGSLRNMMGYFSDDKVAAVTSSLKVYQPRTWVQKLQWVEYIFAIYLRRLMHFVNALYVIPGPGSVYRRSVVLGLGGFDENNLTEDMEIAFKIQKAGFKIRNSISSMVNTVAPEDFTTLLRQRIRWYAGFYDNALLYKEMFFNPKYGALGMFILPASVVWIAVLFASLGKIMFDVWRALETPLRSLFLVGFDWDLLVASIRNMAAFEPTYITWFAVLFVAISALVIYLGLKLSGETIDIRGKYKFYALHMVAYTVVLSLMWLFALSYVVLRGKTPKNWKGNRT